ncbi:MAG: tetratricopeptide repeat protein [Planctomycetota bacterium]
MKRHHETSRRTVVACLIFITLINLVVYGRAIGFPFITYDDPIVVTQNPVVRSGLSFDSIAWAWTTHHFSNWIPLTWMSLLLDASISGGQAWSFHASNLAIHIATSVCLFFLGRSLQLSPLACLLLALLYSIHPLHVQSVVWISERKGLLSSLFAVLATIGFIRFSRSGLKQHLAMTVLAYTLSLLSKQMAVTLPAVFLVWLLCAPQLDTSTPRLSVKNVACVLALGVVGAAFVLIAYLAQAVGGAIGDLSEFPVSIRITNGLTNYGEYLRKLIVPDDVSFHYHHYGTHPSLSNGVFALLVFGTLSYAFVRSESRLERFGIAWYFIVFLPVIGFVQIGEQRMADRYADLPMIGIYLILAKLYDQHMTKGASRYGLLALLSVVLASLSSSEVSHWQSSRMLYQRALVQDAGNPVALNNLGLLLKQESLAEAESCFRRAMESAPNHPSANNNLGLLLVEKGQVTDGLSFIEKAIARQPNYSEARLNRAIAYGKLGRWTETRDELELLQTQFPENAKVQLNLGTVYRNLGDLVLAIRHYDKALSLDPSMAEAAYYAADTYLRRGDIDAAQEHYRAVTQLRPRVAEAWAGLICCHALKVNPVRVDQLVGSALRSFPDSPEIRIAAAYAVCKRPWTPESNQIIDSLLQGPMQNLSQTSSLRRDFVAMYQLCHGATPPDPSVLAHLLELTRDEQYPQLHSEIQSLKLRLKTHPNTAEND